MDKSKIEKLVPPPDPNRTPGGHVPPQMVRDIFHCRLSNAAAAAHFRVAHTTVERIRNHQIHKDVTKGLHRHKRVWEFHEKKVTRTLAREIYTSTDTNNIESHRQGVSIDLVRKIRRRTRHRQSTAGLELGYKGHKRQPLFKYTEEQVRGVYQSDGSTVEIAAAWDTNQQWACDVRAGRTKRAYTADLGPPGGHGLPKYTEPITTAPRGDAKSIIQEWHTAMIARTTDLNDPFYPAIGGCGLYVCDAWHDLETFAQWCCSQPIDVETPGVWLCRLDSNRGYEPDNCLIS